MVNLPGILQTNLRAMYVDLTPLGEHEARLAGVLLEHFIIDVAKTSVLKRAILTLAIILNEMGKSIPVIKSAALNERNYGNLQV